ncbi:hypothetical protein TNCV_1355531 [Trichonephila clavipes]|uniref:Uncharacterized protein n=1 Tax=Trichonephila clavipes TaxID=2585209 RepID=A0A8X6SB66_TRICX|nr:hypothetical protein TNCV_1355531 [Trichonephila clavipes]
MSPYLNPIKHVWDVLGRSITAQRPATMTVDELKSALGQKWGRLPQGLIKTMGNTTRGLLATDHVILNHGQVTWTTPELAPPSPNYHTTPTGGRFSSRQIYRASLPYTAGL